MRRRQRARRSIIRRSRYRRGRRCRSIRRCAWCSRRCRIGRLRRRCKCPVSRCSRPCSRLRAGSRRCLCPLRAGRKRRCICRRAGVRGFGSVSGGTRTIPDAMWMRRRFCWAKTGVCCLMKGLCSTGSRRQATAVSAFSQAARTIGRRLLLILRELTRESAKSFLC